MSLPKIGIIISSTREGRFGDRPAAWIAEIAAARRDATFEIVDLRDHPLPFYDEAASPAYGAVGNPAGQHWGELMAGFDGFIFITAEYNHSITGVLKNALDYLYPQMNRKPAAFVSYGGVGGARAVEQLRLILVELQMAPLRNAVHIGMSEYLGVVTEGKSIADYPYLAESARVMLDDLLWWTRALADARSAG
ncbi:NADPH-dependent FMN reductase [Tropicimonas sp.]|uniref:NADPH-dependent FMN reductase n=1 Tax=Tropicimonas sp. TaxID=2067044 RepID=UPI003A8ACBE0